MPEGREFVYSVECFVLCQRAGNWFVVSCHQGAVPEDMEFVCCVECIVSCVQCAVPEGRELACSVECVTSCGQVAVP